MTTDAAQEQTMRQEEPQKEHTWLQRFVGEWTMEEETTDAGPPAMAGGTERVRSLGGLWIVAEGRGEMPGGSASTTMLTLGYDPQRKRYAGTWIGSMMSHMWVYDGEVDAGGKSISLHCEGPAMDGSGKMAPYKDVHEFLSDDHRVLKAYTHQSDGSWQHFMTTHYHRKS